MAIKTSFRRLFGTALIAGASLISSFANAGTALNLEERVVLENPGKPISQSIATYGMNRALVQTSEGRDTYGVNAENDNFRLNAGVKQYDKADSDIANYSFGLKSGINFIEVESDKFDDPKKEDCYAGRMRLKPTDNLEVQASANTIGDWRAMTLVQVGKNSKVGMAGGQNEGLYREAQFFGTTKITENYNANGGIKTGDNGFFEARVRFGRKASALNGAGSYGVMPGFVNDPSEATDSLTISSDVTMPYALSGNFNFLTAEAQCGEKTGDVGGDIRYTDGKSAYARFALNVGDYGFVKDVLVTPGVHKDLVKDNYGLEASICGQFGPTQVWYRGNFNQDSKPEHAVYLAVRHEFGGKK
ncbi:Uncharacterised protein [uncultured archaeon]|nr:Uncharacterised protein [uncultured archaeon]